MIDPLDLAQALIRCPSITPRDEGAQDTLEKVLKPMGFECHRLEFGGVPNLFARRGRGGRHFCFAGHTDVVPPGDEKLWTHPPFSATISGTRLYGRGASDMKGNIAAFVAAASEWIGGSAADDHSLSLLITGDEEGEARNGTVRVLEWMKQHGHIPDLCVVGEPTNDEAIGDAVKIGRRGSLTGRLTVHGTQGHVAYPHRADNPLPRLVRLLDALVSTILDQGSAYFPATTVQMTSIDVGNTADNVIPSRGTAVFNIRFNDRWSSETLSKKIRAILDEVTTEYDLQLHSGAESFITRPGELTNLVAGAIEEITGRKPQLTTTGGTSDARFVHIYCPVVEFGLINKTIHKVDEHLEIPDLRRLTEIYSHILKRFFGQPGR